MTNPYLYIVTIFSLLNPTSVNDIPPVIDNGAFNINSMGIYSLAQHSISLNNRYEKEWINNVLKDNILLTLDYMNGNIHHKEEIKWEEVQKPKHFWFTLQPGESFAFHDQILSDYSKNIVKTTNAHFNYQEGFKSDGLYGDGVCHLASLMYWVAKDAKLQAAAPTNHDFAIMNGIPKEYGVSIYTLPGSFEISAKQNLYLTNNLSTSVTFTFDYNGTDLSVEITSPTSN